MAPNNGGGGNNVKKRGGYKTQPIGSPSEHLKDAPSPTEVDWSQMPEGTYSRIGHRGGLLTYLRGVLSILFVWVRARRSWDLCGGCGDSRTGCGLGVRALALDGILIIIVTDTRSGDHSPAHHHQATWLGGGASPFWMAWLYRNGHTTAFWVLLVPLMYPIFFHVPAWPGFVRFILNMAGYFPVRSRDRITESSLLLLHPTSDADVSICSLHYILIDRRRAGPACTSRTPSRAGT